VQMCGEEGSARMDGLVQERVQMWEAGGTKPEHLMDAEKWRVGTLWSNFGGGAVN